MPNKQDLVPAPSTCPCSPAADDGDIAVAMIGYFGMQGASALPAQLGWGWAGCSTTSILLIRHLSSVRERLRMG